MRKYVGVRGGDLEVHVVDERGNRHMLDPRYDLVNHSPDGFECGYRGSGPAQLALAILADAFNDDDMAMRLYQQFKEAKIATLPTDTDWEITTETIDAWSMLQVRVGEEETDDTQST